MDTILTVSAGGQAAPAIGSVSEGEKIVGQAVAAFGTVHVLINNAGILRKSSYPDRRDPRSHAQATRPSRR